MSYGGPLTVDRTCARIQPSDVQNAIGIADFRMDRWRGKLNTGQAEDSVAVESARGCVQEGQRLFVPNRRGAVCARWWGGMDCAGIVVASAEWQQF